MAPPGPASLDTHAAVGMQATFGVRRDEARLALLKTLADAGAIDLVATGNGRGWAYDRGRGLFQSDRNGETATLDALRALAAPGSELTFAAVPAGSGRRMAIDRDNDRFGDGTEREFGTDPTDPTDFPR